LSKSDLVRSRCGKVVVASADSSASEGACGSGAIADAFAAPAVRMGEG
jgi:hypothetical protein